MTTETTTSETTGTTAETTDATGVVDQTVAPVAGTETVVAPVRPEGLPDALWDDKVGVKWADVQARLSKADELEGAVKAATEGVPEKPEDYKLEIAGEPINGTDGKPIGIDANDPLAKSFVAFAHEHKLPQGHVSGLLRVYAESVMGEAKAVEAAMAEEIKALGEKAGERIGAVKAFITQHAGQDAKHIVDSLGSAGAVRALEKVMALVAGPGTSTLPGQGAAPKSIADTWFPNSMKKSA